MPRFGIAPKSSSHVLVSWVLRGLRELSFNYWVSKGDRAITAQTVVLTLSRSHTKGTNSNMSKLPFGILCCTRISQKPSFIQMRRRRT